MIYGNSGFIITNDYDPDTFAWIGHAGHGRFAPFLKNDGENRAFSVSRDGKKFYVLNPVLAPHG